MIEKTSFTVTIKNEIANNNIEKLEARSLLAAFIRLSGTINFSSKGDRLTIKTENATTARFLYKIIREYYPTLNISLGFLKQMKLYKATEYLININGQFDEFLNELDIDLLNDKISRSLYNTENKMKAYFAGSFLAAGSCTDPLSSNYHLEISSNDEEYAQSLLKLTTKIKNLVFSFKIIQRRNKWVVYLKRSDQISDFLAYINAYNSCLEFEDIRTNRDFANSTNRLVNCDSYNFKKTTDIATKQVEMIDYIEKKIGINHISNEKLRVLCKIRKENIEANYNELALMLSEELHTSVSKSNINHLFIKLKKLYEEISQ
ncbi:MAG: DNA-binding protein WhiA [bacterium]|nr:DNA-binding protein WhiA [bacterium]MDY4158805.1 DNA-binding protein WhiA [Candidatus Onthovivens sp.]